MSFSFFLFRRLSRSRIVGQRKSEKADLLWLLPFDLQLPKGGKEEDEEFEAGALREAWEEVRCEHFHASDFSRTGY